MAIVPTTWDPATKGFNAELSGGDLLYANSSYYQNSVRSAASFAEGVWCWEITALYAGLSPKVGVIQTGQSGGSPVDGGADAYNIYAGDTITKALGDVITVVVVWGSGRADISTYVNGVFTHTEEIGLFLVDSLTAAMQDNTDSHGSSPIWSANFGQSEFLFAPSIEGLSGIGAPSGFAVDGFESAGFGDVRLPTSVTGIAAAGLGAPMVPVPQFVFPEGFEAAGVGTPTMFPTRRVTPTGIESGAPSDVGLKTDQVVAVAAAPSPRFGDVRVHQEVVPVVNPPRPRVLPVALDGFGVVAASSWVSCAVEAIEVAGLGTPSNTQTVEVAGLDVDGLGAVNTSAGYPVATVANLSAIGVPTLTVSGTALGIQSVGFGAAQILFGTSAQATGMEALGMGTPSAFTTFRVDALRLPPGFGTPSIGRVTC